MYNNQTITLSQFVRSKWQDYMLLAKHKLNAIVVITSVLGFVYAGSPVLSFDLLWLFVAGFLVTASANAINEILEKEYDAMMKRTQNRPLPAQRMSDTEAWLFAGLTGVIGLILLWYVFNQTAALLGAISIISYAFVYTPLKRIHPISVFVGAIPGALPPLIGYIAYTGVFNEEALLLFAFQFLWQFPHFWAIAWLAFEDYKVAGYKLLPTGKKDLSVPIQSIFFIVLLAGLSILPYMMGNLSIWGCVISFIASIAYLIPAIKLLRTREDKDARALMFASFLYLPIVFTALILFS